MAASWSLAAATSLLVRWLLICSHGPFHVHAETEKHGNWSTITCDDYWRYRNSESGYYDPASQQWRWVGAPDAWRDAVAAWWEVDQKRNDTSFTGSVSHTVDDYAGRDCGRLGRCLSTPSCYATALAGLKYWFHFLKSTCLIKDYYSARNAALYKRPGGAYGGGSKLRTPSDDTWKPLLADLVKIGSASALGRILYFKVRTNPYVTESGSVNAAETGLALVNTTIQVAQEWAAGKWKSETTPTSKPEFVDTMYQAMQIWQDVATEGLLRLFNGSQSGIENLHDIISDGKLGWGFPEPNATRAQNGRDDMQDAFVQTPFAFSLQAVWRLTDAAPVVLDVGQECGNNRTDGFHFQSSVTCETAGACVSGRQYYIVSANGKGKSFGLLPGLEPGKYSTRWKDSITIDDLITGSIRTYVANGNKNTNSSVDLQNSTTALNLVADGIRAAGVFSIPVCTVALAYQSRLRGAATQSPGYPCNEADSVSISTRLAGAQLTTATAVLRFGLAVTSTPNLLRDIPGKSRGEDPLWSGVAHAGGRAWRPEIVERLLDLGANPRLEDSNGWSALHYAADAGQEEIARLLLECCLSLLYRQAQTQFGLPVNRAFEHGPTFRLLPDAMDPVMCVSSLETAMIGGRVDIVNGLVERGVEIDVDRLGVAGANLLARVCEGTTEGHVEMARLLIKMGVDVHGTSGWGDRTPLQLVCAKNGANALQMASLLLENEASASLCGPGTKEGTPLKEACENGNLSLVKLLLSKTEDPMDDFREEDIIALQETACATTSKECSEVIFGLFPLSSLDTELGRRCLVAACISGNMDMAKMLLAGGASIQSLDSRGIGAVQAAWQSGNIELMRMIIRAGGDPNAANPPLITSEWPIGTDEHQVACLETFIKLGANPVGKNGAGFTPLHAACKASAVGCVQLLLEKYAADATAASNSHEQPLYQAVKSGNVEVVKMLVIHGADVNSWCAGNETAEIYSLLYEACQLKDSHYMVDYILSQGTARNAEEASVRYVYPARPSHLYPASRKKRTGLQFFLESLSNSISLQAFEALLEGYIGDLDEVLVIASTEGRYDAVEILLERGADPNARAFGTTPLCQAAGAGRLDVAKLLVSYGANTNARNMSGLSPLAVWSRFRLSR
ncbi:hypothetical protein NLG97_g1888 [Lecanicillium saksenae]|uniref:Uncharacterized protein n=1 Tax=Lecanicillium saksenae TaxID=468837 RepID=A0ACC1R4B8_9HYPO|nr:hypothetical protein NLG97_g1888 [Lecanicillium saksenae]